MQSIPQIMPMGRAKKHFYTDKPPGNLKKIKELFEIGVSQNQKKANLRVLQVLYRYLHDGQITPLGFYDECNKPLCIETNES